MKEEFYGKLVGFPFNAGIHQEGVVVKCMGSGSVGMEEGVAQFVGADEGPEGFVDVEVDMNEWAAVEAGEKLGFLPGDLQCKVDPYLRPLYDALFEMLGPDTFAKQQERGCIEVAPLAYMRGRTLDDSFIILDEAQNTTPAQMKMFLTRIGFGSKVIITGDQTQKDLPSGATSGLDTALKVLKYIDDIGFCYLTSSDVVRHPLVQKIVKAYDDYEKKQKPAKSRKDDRYAVKNKEYRR